MGSAVSAACQCGLSANILVGGGMANFLTTCFFPCLCRRCKEVVQVNLFAKHLRCPKCRSRTVTPYDAADLSSSVGTSADVEWNAEERLGRQLVLTDADYECPRCGMMSLRFGAAGLCWD